jgi:uncharacterized protein
MNYLSAEELARTAPAESAAFNGPIPTQIVSNGEFTPFPQTREQQRVEARVKELAAELAPKHGMSRRRFLASSAGMATALLAMNDVFGPIFDVARAEAQTPGVADANAKALAGQFILDCQTHFVRDDFAPTADLIPFAEWAMNNGNPGLAGLNDPLRFKFANYLKEVFIDSDTKIAVLSGTPSDNPQFEALRNYQIAAARDAINAISDSRRMLSHAIIKPRADPRWLDEVNEAIAIHKPDSWKGYTIGDPFNPGTAPSSCWNLDDEKLMYPFYERIVKAGITTLCVHKGILPEDYKEKWKGVWEHATVKDVAKAAKQWPQINFVIYHAALRPVIPKTPDGAVTEFQNTKRMEWASDLAEIPGTYGVTNVYAEIGTAFANTAVTKPELAAALLGILIKGMGFDHVLWGTDSVWYGSPQWQIAALRSLTMPEALQKEHGFAPLGPPDGPVKRAILGENAARLYKIPIKTALGEITPDKIASIRAEYVARGEVRSNMRYGYVDPGRRQQA